MSQEQEALNKAMEELDQVEKSLQGEEESELDALTKALEEELGEDLSKSDDEEADLSKGHKEPDGDEDGEDEDGDGDGDMEKSDDYGFDDELIKASEAYDELTKSVQDGIGSVLEEVDSIKKSMAALINLHFKKEKIIKKKKKKRKKKKVF